MWGVCGWSGSFVIVGLHTIRSHLASCILGGVQHERRTRGSLLVHFMVPFNNNNNMVPFMELFMDHRAPMRPAPPVAMPRVQR